MQALHVHVSRTMRCSQPGPAAGLYNYLTNQETVMNALLYIIHTFPGFVSELTECPAASNHKTVWPPLAFSFKTSI